MTLRDMVIRLLGHRPAAVLPPAIGSGDAGTFDLDGHRQVPPHGWHRYAPTLPVCGGARCPAWDAVDAAVGICLVDPCASGPECRGAMIAGESICPLGVQRIQADLDQALEWIAVLSKTGGRGQP